MIRFLHFFIFLCIASSGFSHKVDQSYIYLNILENGMTGNFQISIDDLNKEMNFSIAEDAVLEDFADKIPLIQSHYLKNVSFGEDGKYKFSFTDSELLDARPIAQFLVLKFDIPNSQEIPDNMNVAYNIGFDQDKNHRGLLMIENNWKAGILNNEAMSSLIFGPKNKEQVLKLDKGSILQGFWAMVKMGVWHIWIGIDHILFLLALALPSVVRRTKLGQSTGRGLFGKLNAAADSWTAVEKFKPAFFYIIKIITFFTIGHTITLSLAALNIVNLPSGLVESIIALSIALAALHNIVPVFGNKEWLIAGGFGLFHGFGFASLFRKSRFYGKFLVYGSIALILVSLYWFIERAFGIDIGITKPIRSLLK